MATGTDRFEEAENDQIIYFTTYLTFRLFVNAYMEQPEPVFIEHVNKLVASWRDMMLNAVRAKAEKAAGSGGWAFEQRHAIHCAAQSCVEMLLQLRGVKASVAPVAEPSEETKP